MAGHFHHAQQAALIGEALDNPDSGTKDERATVVAGLYANMKANKVSGADEWVVGARDDIEAGLPVRREAPTPAVDATNLDMSASNRTLHEARARQAAVYDSLLDRPEPNAAITGSGSVDEAIAAASAHNDESSGILADALHISARGAQEEIAAATETPANVPPPTSKRRLNSEQLDRYISGEESTGFGQAVAPEPLTSAVDSVTATENDAAPPIANEAAAMETALAKKYYTAVDANNALAKYGLADSHQIVKANNKFALLPIHPAATISPADKGIVNLNAPSYSGIVNLNPVAQETADAAIIPPIAGQVAESIMGGVETSALVAMENSAALLKDGDGKITSNENHTSGRPIKGHVTIDQLVELSKNKTSGNDAYHIYRPVSENESNTLKEKTNVDVTGFSHGIDEAAIRHILERHGNEKDASLSVTPDDIKNITDITDPSKADYVEYGGKTKKGLDKIVYKKRVNGHTVVVEEVRTGRSRLNAVTMYKVRAGQGGTSKEAVPQTPETLRTQPTDTGNKSIVPTPEKTIADNTTTVETSKIDGDVKFSRSQSTKYAYEQRIDELFNGAAPKQRGGVIVLDSSDMIDMLGYGKDKVTLVESKVLKSGEVHHLTPGHWKKIPQWLSNPVAVFKSDTVEGRLVFVAPESINGDPILIIVEPNATEGRAGETVHLLVNGLNNPSARITWNRWIRNEDLIYIDNEKSRDFITASRLQLPTRAQQNKPGSKVKILTEKNLVKYRSQNNTPLNSKTTGTPTNTHTETTLISSLTNALDNTFGKGWFGRLEATGKFKLVARDEALQIAGKNAADAKGFYDPKTDTSYFIYDNIGLDASDKELLGLVLHEVGVHALQLGKTNEDFQALLKRFKAMRLLNPKVKEAFASVPDDTHPDYVVEEALAYFIEHNPTASLTQRIIEAFRRLVRAIGRSLPMMQRAKFYDWANKLSETELQNMAMAALRQAPDSLLFDQPARANETLLKASKAGYKGKSVNEAQEWLRAVGKGLDMSQEARMDRAKNMGFNVKRKLYMGLEPNKSGIVDEISEFNDRTIWVSTNPNVANSYAGNDVESYDKDTYGSGARIYELLARTVNTPGVAIDADWGEFYDLKNAVSDADNIRIFNSDKELELPQKEDYEGYHIDDIADDVRNDGFSWVRFDNITDQGHGETADANMETYDGSTIAIFDRSLVRSIHAAFDPDYIDSPNLLASKKDKKAHKEQPRLAPNGKPSNLNAVQYFQVRTDAFKKWFGDWEIAAALPIREAFNFDQARNAVKDFQNKPLENRQTGMIVTLSRNNLDKMLSSKAVGKSESAEGHSLAVANVDNLFDRAILGWSKPDREANTNIISIHRFFAPLNINGQARLVKMTVKEFVSVDQGNKVYSVESIELDEKTPAAQWVDATVRDDNLDPTSIRSAEAVKSLAQRVQSFKENNASKVVDENGEPLVVYHGTHEDFNEFHTNAALGGLIFTSPSPKEAGVFAYAKGANIIPSYIRAENPAPKVYDAANEAAAAKTAKTKGYDAIRVRDDVRSEINWAVFNPDQIKSAIGNNGNFDTKNPDIRYSFDVDKAQNTSGSEMKPDASRLVYNPDMKLTPIPLIDDPDMPDMKNTAALRRYLKKKLQGETFVNRQTGNDIKIFASGLEATLKNRNTQSRRLFSILPELLNQAIYTGYDENTKKDDKPHVKGYETYYAAASIDGRIHAVKILVDIVESRERGYYYHQINEVHLGDSVGKSRSQSDGNQTNYPESPGSEISLGQLVGEINTKNDIRFSRASDAMDKAKRLLPSKDNNVVGIGDIKKILSTGKMPKNKTTWQDIEDNAVTLLTDSSRPFDAWARKLNNMNAAGQLILAKDRAKRRTAMFEKQLQ